MKKTAGNIFSLMMAFWFVACGSNTTSDVSSGSVQVRDKQEKSLIAHYSHIKWIGGEKCIRTF